MIPKTSFTILLFFIYSYCTAQDFPKDFISPITIPIELVGNFGELRKNHFHTGIDIRTQQVEGLPIQSIQEGYVSRINISPTGYGNALYISHPNGYTSVYAHLQQFNTTIKEYINNKQYELKKNEIEYYPKINELKVKKGDTIALSGNSGGSQGPHLHFEIRDTKTENALNPFLFGFDVKDSKNPIFNQVYLYPIEGKINGNNKKFLLNNLTQTIKGYGSFGIGIKAFDKHDALDNLNGIYSIKIYKDKELIFYFKADEISFDRPRLINSSTDYSANINQGSWIYKCFKSEGNDLKMINETINNGIINLQPNLTKNIKIEVRDFANNVSIKEFNILGIAKESNSSNKTSVINSSSYFLKYHKDNKIKTQNLELTFPKGVFDEDSNFEISEINDGYSLQSYDFPAFNYYTLKAIPKSIDLNDLDKTVFVRYYKSNGVLKHEYLVGTINNNSIVGRFRDFGIFKFKVDKIPPIIKSRNSSSLKTNDKLKFTLIDEISGIKNYEVFIDDKWFLCIFDKKNNLLTVNLDETINKGFHKIIVKATDMVNNSNIISFDFEKL